jgi:hypothetical protein
MSVSFHQRRPSPRPSPRGRGRKRRGVGLVVAITTLLVVMLMTAAIMRSIVMGMRQSRQSAVELQAQWLADAAAARAAAQLRTDRQYGGETWRAETTAGREDAIGIAEIHVEPLENSNQRRVAIDVRYPDHPWRRVAISRTYQIEIPDKQPPAGNRPQENAP